MPRWTSRVPVLQPLTDAFLLAWPPAVQSEAASAHQLGPRTAEPRHRRPATEGGGGGGGGSGGALGTALDLRHNDLPSFNFWGFDQTPPSGSGEREKTQQASRTRDSTRCLTHLPVLCWLNRGLLLTG